jgi:thiol-disulfide isomerase/thioredoxin
MLRQVAGGLPALVLAVVAARADDAGRVSGRVVDADGRPVAGADVAATWLADVDQPLRPIAGVKTDAQGRFSLERPAIPGDQAVMAIAPDGASGGAAVASEKGPGGPLAIRLGPMAEVRGRFTCSESGEPPVGTNLYLSLKPGKNRLIAHRSRGSEFALKAPVGEYDLVGHGSFADFEIANRAVAVRAGVNDLEAIDLKLKPLARLYGKPMPAWSITDARGLPQGKSTALADFKGKWVVLDFWGYWCHPCVGVSLPSWVQFAADHEADRDKFVVLAFHDPQAESFADLDAKLAPVVKSSWGGKPLPFPILLDSTGATVERLGVERFPTALLIDPEGRLVRTGDDVETHLAGKLAPVPIERRIANALERVIPLSTEGLTLAGLIDVLGGVTRLKIDLDEAELKAVGVSRDAAVASHTGSMSLRDWLDRALGPHDLAFVAGADGLRIVRKAGS